MQTSCFRLKGKDPRAISISLFPPKWYAGRQYKGLAPTKELLFGYKYGRVTKEQYAEVYTNYLNGLEADSLYRQLKVWQGGNGEEPILLCFEAPGEFCHRRIAAEWFERELGIIVPEYDPAEPPSDVFFHY